MTAARKDERQLSKSQLLRATRVLYLEHNAVMATLARRWKRRVWWVAVGAFSLGATLGTYAAKVGLTELPRIVLGSTP